MNKMEKKEKPIKEKKIYNYSFGEELGNAISHGCMMIATLILLPISAVHSYLKGGVLACTGVSVFVISIFLMFMSSTLYHSMDPKSKHKRVLKILDHIFIYFAIAGTYTPIALYVIGGWQGIVIICIQWAVVLFGIFYKSLMKNSIPKLSLAIYLIMGWTIILFFPLFIAKANAILIWLIAAGGVLYTIGAVFYALRNFKYHHMVWHIFINLAAITHFIGITFFMY